MNKFLGAILMGAAVVFFSSGVVTAMEDDDKNPSYTFYFGDTGETHRWTCTLEEFKDFHEKRARFLVQESKNQDFVNKSSLEKEVDFGAAYLRELEDKGALHLFANGVTFLTLFAQHLKEFSPDIPAVAQLPGTQIAPFMHLYEVVRAQGIPFKHFSGPSST
ncbi:MAG: hypothetical protein LBC25_02865 [Holosporales bacterium]|jgi:hypothetical protein|nr:hypothetical protein [Holosporales bacterium]